jgi:hypothetical protein
MTDPRKHNYYEKLMRLIERSELPPGRITEVNVYHDDWCRVYRGGYCDCDPEVELRPAPEEN